jgi:hypothetical protein
MHDLDKRVKKNPFVSDATRILGEHGYHMYRFEYGDNGSVKIIVFMDNRQGCEVPYEFKFPPKLDRLIHLRWQDGMRRDIQRLEADGFRPPRTQAAPRSIRSPIVMSVSSAVSEAEKLFTAIKNDPEIKPVLTETVPSHFIQPMNVIQPMTPRVTNNNRIMTLRVNLEDVATILSAIGGSAELISIVVEPLPDVIEHVPETVAPVVPEIVSVRPPRMRGGLLQLIVDNLPDQAFRSDDFVDLVGKNYPHLDEGETRRRISTHLSTLKKDGVVRRISSGLYKRSA